MVNKRGYKTNPKLMTFSRRIKAPPPGSTLEIELVTQDGIGFFKRTFTDGKTGEKTVTVELSGYYGTAKKVPKWRLK